MSAIRFPLFTPLLLLLALPSAARAEPERMTIGEAARAITTEACERVYSDDAEQLAQCKHEYFDERAVDPKHLWEHGEQGDRQCLVAGGVCPEKLYTCVDAMTLLVRSYRNKDASSLLHALGDVVNVCASSELCPIDACDD